MSYLFHGIGPGATRGFGGLALEPSLEFPWLTIIGKSVSMAEQPMHRRLAAIMAADVAGYSRLMGID